MSVSKDQIREEPKRKEGKDKTQRGTKEKTKDKKRSVSRHRKCKKREGL